MIHFTLDLKPQPKQRARVTKKGRAYTPSATRDFELNVRTLAGEHISEPLRGALSLEVLFVYPRLKSEPKKHSGRKYKTTRPDLSNLIKSLEDGLEGVAFSDDAQIVSLSAEKVYASLNESAHIEVTLLRLSDDPERRQCRQHRQHEQRAITRQTRYSNTGVEGDTSAREPDPDRPLTAQERRELKEKRREINRAEHKRAQEAKHNRLARERGARKLEECRHKLTEVENRRRAEREEQKRARELERERSMQELYERYRVRRSSATQEDGDE